MSSSRFSILNHNVVSLLLQLELIVPSRFWRSLPPLHLLDVFLNHLLDNFLSRTLELPNGFKIVSLFDGLFQVQFNGIGSFNTFNIPKSDCVL